MWASHTEGRSNKPIIPIARRMCPKSQTILCASLKMYSKLIPRLSRPKQGKQHKSIKIIASTSQLSFITHKVKE